MKNLHWITTLCLLCHLSSAAIAAPPATAPAPISNSQPTSILLRVAWEFCQPEEEMLDWTFIDAQIYAAKSQGKKVILHVDPLSGIPAWVNQKLNAPSGHQPAHLSGNSLLTIWTKFIQRMGEKYAREAGIEKVLISHVQSLSDWNHHSQPAEQLSAWMQVVDAFGRAFPSHELVVTQPPLAEPRIVSWMQDYAAAHIGERYQSIATAFEPVPSPHSTVYTSPSDLMLWENLNVTPDTQARQNSITGRTSESMAIQNKAAEKTLKPIQKKRGTLVDKMVTNISLLGTPLWLDIFQ